MIPPDRFASALSAQSGRHRRRLFTAVLVGGLISLLIYQTQWADLRPGLFVLLAGQSGVVAALLWRITTLSRACALEEASFGGWVTAEVRFIKALALFETACQVAGFELLGYAIWLSTRSAGLALAIGVVYPVTVYFGMTRRTNRMAIRHLNAMKNESQA